MITDATEATLLKPLARLAHECDGLREDNGHDSADLKRLCLGVALEVDAVDGRDGHVDGELDGVIGPGQRLLALHLRGELGEAPLQVLRVTEQISEAAALHEAHPSDELIDCTPMPDVRESEYPEPSKAEIKAQVARESERRARLGVPVAAGGVLYMLSGIILTTTLRGIPTVGVLQGVAPALRGEANPAVSPRAGEVQFQSHHSFGLVAGSLLVALAYAAIVVVLLFVLGATRFRHPQMRPTARWLVLVGGSAVALLSVATQILLAIKTHNFVTGHDFSDHAVEAVTHNSIYTTLAYVTPVAGIALAAGMIMAMLGAVRVGLLPRWVAMVGGV